MSDQHAQTLEQMAKSTMDSRLDRAPHTMPEVEAQIDALWAGARSIRQQPALVAALQQTLDHFGDPLKVIKPALAQAGDPV